MDSAQSGKMKSWAALALLAVLFFAVNTAAQTWLRDARIDMTEEKLFTVSDGARAVLGALDGPVRMRLYYSPALGEAAPAFAAYHQRVREFLMRCADIAGGRLIVEFTDPEPFSDAEDRAVAFGLQGVALNEAGDLGYFGAAATNSAGDAETIPFLSFEREKFLEYDLMRMTAALSGPEKPVVGLVSSLPVTGGAPGFGPQAPRWAVLDAIAPFYEIRDLGVEFDAVSPDTGVLLMIHPKGLSDAALYAVDQFVMRGGRVLAFIDPNTEVAQLYPGPDGPRGEEASDLGPLLAAWGVRLEENTVAADLDAARRVSLGSNRAADYVAWLQLKPENGDAGDAAAGAFKLLNMATAGVLRQSADAETVFTPLLWTGARSMRLNVEQVRGPAPDVSGLFRAFKPSGEPLTLAARVSGRARSAWPDGPPEGSGQDPGAHLAAAGAPLNIILAADADMTHDALWSEKQSFLGRTLTVPNADNANFTVNLIDALAGAAALTDLRAKTVRPRPFARVEELRLEAERAYLQREQDLADRLGALKERLAGLTGEADAAGGFAAADAAGAGALAEARADLIETRRELRAVRRALREDVDRLENALKAFNILAAPAALALSGLGAAVWGRARRRRAARTGGFTGRPHGEARA